TYKKGGLVVDAHEDFTRQPAAVPKQGSTMNLRYTASKDFKIRMNRKARIRVIEIVPNQIVTKQIITKPALRDGCVVSDTGRDILKLVVVERHHATGNVGVGFVRGFKLKRGALGSTVAHDAHNVVVVGVNDADVVRAIGAFEAL